MVIPCDERGDPGHPPSMLLAHYSLLWDDDVMKHGRREDPNRKVCLISWASITKVPRVGR